MPRENKRGKLSQVERDFIKANSGKMTVLELSAHLKRTVAAIIEVQRAPTIEPKTQGEAEHHERFIIKKELRENLVWKRLKEEFSPDELKYFEEEYIRMVGQFNKDVLPTEEMQIFQLIKFSILMSRNLMGRQRSIQDIQRMEGLQEDFLAQFGGNPKKMDSVDRRRLEEMEATMATMRAADQSRTREYTELHDEYTKLMKNLKGTRDQRVKYYEDGKATFLGLVKMLQTREAQLREGRQMELMRMATDKEYERLGQPHQYMDGTFDLPILSPETVEALDKAPASTPEEEGALPEKKVAKPRPKPVLREALPEAPKPAE